MRRGSSRSSIFIVVIAVGYVFLTLPIVYALLILVISLLGGSVVKSNEDHLLYMFGLIGRLIHKAKPILGSEASFRSDVVGACASMDRYRHYMDSIIKRKKQLFFMLNTPQRSAAIGNFHRLKKIEYLTFENAKLLDKIKEFSMNEFGISTSEIRITKASSRPAIDLIEHLVRDWSVEPEDLRSRAALCEMFLPWMKGKKRILVPGSGLGFLATEISSQYPDALVDAPELSAAMYLGSQFIMRQAQTKENYTDTVYPYINQFSHWRYGSDQLQPVHLKLSAKGHPNFMYQDFLTLKDVKYDAIATLFFIDTAQNVFSYIDKIFDLLEPGGVWCNHGPLKWGTAAFAELSADELLGHMKSSGWEIIKFSDDAANRYNGSEKSMLDTKYRLVGWVARKRSTNDISKKKVNVK